MAARYTYDDFQKAAQSAGLFDSFNDADLRLARQNPDAGMSILNYKLDYGRAATPEARALANAGAENIRSVYGGYTSGATGGGYYLDPISPASFQRAEAPVYDDQGLRAQYASQMEELRSRAPFSYDPAGDPAFQAYRKQYAREGRRASEDVMGQYAAMTGGMPSTAAVTASQQAGDYYASQMADRIPELYQAAYDRYMREYQKELQDLQLLGDAEQRNYSRYLDALGQHNAEQSFGYQQLLDEIGQQSALRSERAAAEERARENELTLAQLGASVGDYAGLQRLGITPNSEELLKMALANAGRTAPIGSGGNYTYDVGDGDGGGKWGSLESWVQKYGADSAEDYIKEHYKELGFKSAAEATAGWKNYLLEQGLDGGLLSGSRLTMYQEKGKEILEQYGGDYFADWLERIQKSGNANQTDALKIGTFALGG